MDQEQFEAGLVGIRETGMWAFLMETYSPNLVKAVAVLAVPLSWNEELGLEILEFIGFEPEKAKLLLGDVQELSFVLQSNRQRHRMLGEQGGAREFFLTRAEEEFNLPDLYKFLAENYEGELSTLDDRDARRYRSLTLSLINCETHIDVEKALDRIAAFVVRAILHQRLADLHTLCRILRLKTNVEALGNQFVTYQELIY